MREGFDGIKRVALVATFALGLGGCTWLANTLGGTPDASTQTAIVHSFTTACEAYAQALKAAAVARQAHALSDAQVATIDAVRPGANGLCQGPMPTNVASSAVIVVTATAQIIGALGSN
jgi:hypothetical protein